MDFLTGFFAKTSAFGEPLRRDKMTRALLSEEASKATLPRRYEGRKGAKNTRFCETNPNAMLVNRIVKCRKANGCADGWWNLIRVRFPKPNRFWRGYGRTNGDCCGNTTCGVSSNSAMRSSNVRGRETVTQRFGKTNGPRSAPAATTEDQDGKRGAHPTIRRRAVKAAVIDRRCNPDAFLLEGLRLVCPTLGSL
jgi:hypothetical protein